MVADPAMVSYHGADAARRFILTILNMVGEPQREFKRVLSRFQSKEVICFVALCFDTKV